MASGVRSSRPRRGDGTVTVRGLDDLRRELRKLDDDGLIDGLKDANYDIASRVVSWARSRATTRMERAAAATLKAGRTQARAQVTFGGMRAVFAEGAEFGAMRDKLRNTRHGVITGWNQFREWRGNDTGAGYFLFPAMRDHESDIVEHYADVIEKLASKAFPD